MKLAVVAILRNEGDIARAFLSHLAALFDYAVLMDHGSVDGTEALLAAACAVRPGWVRWRVEVPGHHQARFCAFAMRHLFAATDADMVVFLDADEFIDVQGRAALERALACIPQGRVAGRFTWVDCVPARLDAGEFRIGDAIWAHGADEPFPKIVVPRCFFEATGGALLPTSGAHTVFPGDGGDVAYHPVGALLHVPLRSLAQFRLKTVTGNLSVLARLDNGTQENSHWFEALRRMAGGDLSERDLLTLARRYGHRPEKWGGVLADDGFVSRLLDVASAPLDLPALPAADPWRVVAAVIRDWRAENGRDLALVLDGNVLRRA